MEKQNKTHDTLPKWRIDTYNEPITSIKYKCLVSVMCKARSSTSLRTQLEMKPGWGHWLLTDFLPRHTQGPWLDSLELCKKEHRCIGKVPELIVFSHRAYTPASECDAVFPLQPDVCSGKWFTSLTTTLATFEAIAELSGLCLPHAPHCMYSSQCILSSRVVC